MNQLDIFFNEIQSHPFLSFLKSPKKLALYGGGRICEWLLENMSAYNLPIEIIVDTYKEGILGGDSDCKKR